MNVNIKPSTIEHLLSPSLSVIHLWGSLRTTEILHWRESAYSHYVHVILLQGELIYDGAMLAQELEKLYEFPIHAHDCHRDGVRWDGIVDWLSDLSWVNLGESAEAGNRNHFIAFFYKPDYIFEQDPENFSIFLKVFCDAATEHLKLGNSFHLVLYPTNSSIVDFVRKSIPVENICLKC